MKLSVVIPMYNESAIVADTVATLDAYLFATYAENYELIFCDDGSKDDTYAIVEALLPNYPRVRLVGYPQNRGKGCAVRTGMLAATGDFVIFTDCDLAFGCEIIDKMYQFRLSHPQAQSVIGSRVMEKDGLAGYSFARKVMSRAYIRVVNLFAGTHFRDTQTGIKGFDRALIQQIFPLCEIDRFAFDLEILILSKHFGYTIVEMPVKIIANRNADSKVAPVKDALRMLRDVRKIRRHAKRLKKEQKKQAKEKKA